MKKETFLQWSHFYILPNYQPEIGFFYYQFGILNEPFSPFEELLAEYENTIVSSHSVFKYLAYYAMLVFDQVINIDNLQYSITFTNKRTVTLPYSYNFALNLVPRVFCCCSQQWVNKEFYFKQFGQYQFIRNACFLIRIKLLLLLLAYGNCWTVFELK